LRQSVVGKVNIESEISKSLEIKLLVDGFCRIKK